MALTFRGGIRLESKKKAENSPIETMPAPEYLTLTFSPASLEPVVKAGDRVRMGQTLGKARSEDACPLHAPVSGEVKELGEDRILLENDHKNALSPEVAPFDVPISQATPELLIERIRWAGISDLGRSGEPLAKTLEKARGCAKRLVISCVESEPELSADHRLILEETREAVNGAKILLRATGLSRAVFVVEKARQDGAEALMKICGASQNFGISVVKGKYPQGEDRILIRSITGKRVPQNKTPLEAGYLVLGVECVLAVYRAFVSGLPVTQRVLTVAGDALEQPRNLRVPLGSLYEDAVRFCGGFVKKPRLLLSSGSMRGQAQTDLGAVIDRSTNAVVALREEVAPREETPCIKCGRCVKVCPQRLYPLYIARAVARGAWQNASSWEPEACIECGCCAYSCPAGIPLLEKIRQAKNPPKKGEK